MRLFLLTFGKLRTPGLKEAADYYQGLVRSWVALEQIELKPISVPDKSPETRRLIQEKEGESLLQRLDKLITARGAFYLMDEGGQPKSTREWAQTVRHWEREGISEIGLCIGSSLGFSPEVRSRCHGVFSLGPQTLPHELARVVLSEQLYRAWSVVRGHPYHNEGS